VILFAVSFGTLDPSEVGIRYNNNLVEIDQNKVYNNGRYFLGLGSWFVKFPAQLQTIEFNDEGFRGSIAAWSKEKQTVNLDISFGFKIDRNRVIDIYRRYDHDYAEVFAQIAVAVVKDVAIRYEASDFFVNRRAIAEQMKRTLRVRLKEEYATLEVFNLRGIDIPDKFERKIVEKVVQAQEERTAEEIRLTNVLRAKIEVIKARGDAQINLTLSTAQAERKRLIQEATSLGQAKLREQEAISYQSLQSALGLPGENLLKYRWAQIMDKLEESNADLPRPRKLEFIVGFKSPSLEVTIP